MKEFHHILMTASVVLCSLSPFAWSQGHEKEHEAHRLKSTEVILGAIDIRLTPQRLEDNGITFEYAASIALEEGNRLYLRARAIAAAALLGGEAAQVLLNEIAGQDEHLEIRRQAIVSLSKVFGRKDPRRVHDELTALRVVCPVELQRRIDIERDWLTTLIQPPADAQGQGQTLLTVGGVQ